MYLAPLCVSGLGWREFSLPPFHAATVPVASASGLWQAALEPFSQTARSRCFCHPFLSRTRPCAFADYSCASPYVPLLSYASVAGYGVTPKVRHLSLASYCSRSPSTQLALIPLGYEPTVMPVVGIIILWKVGDSNPRSPVGLAHICAAFILGGLSPSFSANLPPLLCRAVFPHGLFCFVFYCASRFFRSVYFVSSFVFRFNRNNPRAESRGLT